MPTIWMVSAEHGRYTEHFVNAAAGWLDKEDLTSVQVGRRFSSARVAHPDLTPYQEGQCGPASDVYP